MPKKNNHNRFFPFVAFDPLTGTPSQFVAGRFGKIACRARKILLGRNRIEIVAAADTLSWLLWADTAREINFDLLEHETKELDEENGDSSPPTLSDAQLLAHNKKTDTHEKNKEAVPNLNVPELY